MLHIEIVYKNEYLLFKMPTLAFTAVDREARRIRQEAKRVRFF